MTQCGLPFEAVIKVFKVGALARICFGIAALAVALVFGTDYLINKLPGAAFAPGIQLVLKALLAGVAGFAIAHLLLRPVLKKKDPSIDISEPVRSAYDVLSEGVVVLDVEGQILFANEAFHRLLDLESRLLGQRLEQVLGLDVILECVNRPIPSTQVPFHSWRSSTRIDAPTGLHILSSIRSSDKRGAVR